jgi:FKBP-type peptidyl-prolyl cis-trans isomerase FkpA
MRGILILYFAAAVCIIGCKRKYPESKQQDGVDREKMVEASRAAVHDEAKVITEFINRHEWKMQMTGSGLHYEIYEQGKGEKADGNHVLKISYKVFLLDGTLCYEADESHPLNLILGRGQQINGLEEGLMLMNEGSRARFVIPNHLAYGLTGDQAKIPPASALYYDVHFVKMESIPVNSSQ